MKHKSIPLFILIAMFDSSYSIFQTPIAEATELIYSWTGQLVLYDDVSPDLWQIGEDGAHFLLQTIVSSDTEDDNTSQAFAAFMANTSRLWVDGQEATYVGDAYIDFADRDDIVDLISTGGSFSRFGQTLGIASTVALDFATFSFVVDSEAPPRFNPTISNSRATSGPRPYATIVIAGTEVTVVPEPNALLLLSCSLLTLVSRRHR